MSELTDAFEDALDAAEDVKGVREKVHFRGADIDAIFGGQSDDFVMAPGGEADSSPITVSVRLTDCDPLPDNLEPITVRGKELVVLKYDPLEGRVDLTCGDDASEL